MMVVNVPEPATNGKATGMMLPVLAFGSDLKMSMPSVISSPITNIKIEPAKANDGKSTPRTPKNPLPKNKKATINEPDAKAAFHASMSPIFSRSEIKIGTLPIMSMMAKRAKKTVAMWS